MSLSMNLPRQSNPEKSTKSFDKGYITMEENFIEPIKQKVRTALRKATAVNGTNLISEITKGKRSESEKENHYLEDIVNIGFPESLNPGDHWIKSEFSNIFSKILHLYSITVDKKTYDVKLKGLESTFDDVSTITNIASDFLFYSFANDPGRADVIETSGKIRKIMDHMLPDDSTLSRTNIDLTFITNGITDKEGVRYVKDQMTGEYIKKILITEYKNSKSFNEHKTKDIIENVLKKYNMFYNKEEKTNHEDKIERIKNITEYLIQSNTEKELKKMIVSASEMIVYECQKIESEKESIESEINVPKLSENELNSTIKFHNGKSITGQNLEKKISTIEPKEQLKEKIKKVMIAEFSDKIEQERDNYFSREDEISNNKKNMLRLLENYLLDMLTKDACINYIIDKNEIIPAINELENESIRHISQNYINSSILDKMTSRFEKIYSELMIKLKTARNSEEFLNKLVSATLNISNESTGLKKIMSGFLEKVKAHGAAYTLRYTETTNTYANSNEINSMKMTYRNNIIEKQFRTRYSLDDAVELYTEPQEKEAINNSKNSIENTIIQNNHNQHNHSNNRTEQLPSMMIATITAPKQTLGFTESKRSDEGRDYVLINTLIRGFRDNILAKYRTTIDTKYAETKVPKNIAGIITKLFNYAKIEDMRLFDQLRENLIKLENILDEDFKYKDKPGFELDLDLINSFLDYKKSITYYSNELDSFRNEYQEKKRKEGLQNTSPLTNNNQHNQNHELSRNQTHTVPNLNTQENTPLKNNVETKLHPDIKSNSPYDQYGNQSKGHSQLSNNPLQIESQHTLSKETQDFIDDLKRRYGRNESMQYTQKYREEQILKELKNKYSIEKTRPTAEIIQEAYYTINSMMIKKRMDGTEESISTKEIVTLLGTYGYDIIEPVRQLVTQRNLLKSNGIEPKNITEELYHISKKYDQMKEEKRYASLDLSA